MSTAFRRSFQEAVWERLVALGQSERLAAGTYLLRRGEPASLLFVLTSGRVDILDPRTAPATTLGRLGPGEPIGEISFLAGVAATADVRVSRESRAIRFDGRTLRVALEADPELSATFYEALSRTLMERLGRLTASAVAGAFAAREAGRRDPDATLPTVGDAYLDVLELGREPEPFSLEGHDRVTIGRAFGNDLQLRDPRVKPVHAEIVRVSEGLRIVASSAAPVLVDSDWTVSAPLHDGAIIGIGRARLRLDGELLTPLPAPPVFALHVEDVSKSIAGRSILEGIDFSVLSGEVVAVIGPSGAGKSTLIHVMSGVSIPDTGQVRLGGEPLCDVLKRQPTTTAEVPQDDIVLPELTIDESLSFAAKLRAPALRGEDRERLIHDIVADLGLLDVRHSRIGDPERRGVSGGQRKRVNIGQELVSHDNRVLFLDEPTSGLDPRSTLDIARLARRLADAGRVVVIVTHDLDPALMAEVDQLLVLTRGGRQAWFGPAAGACAAFGVEVPSRLFDRLPDREPAEWADAYASSAMRRALGGRRDSALLDAYDEHGVAVRVSWWRQLTVLVRRVAEVKRRDHTSTSVLVLQPLVVGAVILLVFPHGTSGLLFLVVLACFWFGMSSAVRELITDRVVWMRERKIGLSPSAWVLSKALVTGSVVALQCAALSIVAHLGVGLWGLGFSLPLLTGAAILTGLAGMGTGLLVSAAWKRSEAAVGTIVLLLVPQIAFSGLLMPLSDVSPVAWLLSWLTPVRYAFHLVLLTGVETEYLKLGSWHPRPINGELFLLGLRPAGADQTGLSWVLLAGALIVLIAVQLALTIRLVRGSS